MIRRSTLVLLSCLSALSVPAIQTKSAASSTPYATPASSLVSQAASQSSSQIVAQAEDTAFNGLSIGAKGEPVRQLQKRLKEIDYYDGRIDGLYGLETRRAVVALQKASGLEETGDLTPDTWDAIEAASRETQAAAGVPTATDVVNTDSNASDISQAAPPESELPPVSEIDGEPNAVAAEENEGGVGRILGLSLGLVALIASFGIGFYMANKGKRDLEEPEGWDALDSKGGTLAPVLPTGGGVPLMASSLSSSANLQMNQAGGRGNQLEIQPSGQMGSTAPLSQVDIIDGLVGELRNPDPVKRRKVIWELGQRGNSIAVQPLVDAMVDADSKEKSLLLASLSEIGIRSLKPMNRALAIALQDNNPEVRKNAIRDLSRIYDLVIQISHMLGHATEDEDPEVRQTATWALDKLNQLRKTQDVDSNMRSFTGAGTAPIDLLSSEASIRRSKEMR